MAFAIWLFTAEDVCDRWAWTKEDEGGQPLCGPSASAGLVILFTVSVLWMLQEFHVFRFGQTWPCW